MAIVIGTRPYGKCDVVPELFYVATWFVHVDYIPLIPTGSRLVFGKSGNTYHVVNIPISLKSIFFAWVRTALFVGLVATLIWSLVVITDNHQLPFDEILLPIVLALGSGIFYAFFMIYPRRRMPSYARACKLATLAGLNDTGWAALNVLYGRDPLERPEPQPARL